MSESKDAGVVLRVCWSKEANDELGEFPWVVKADDRLDIHVKWICGDLRKARAEAVRLNLLPDGGPRKRFLVLTTERPAFLDEAKGKIWVEFEANVNASACGRDAWYGDCFAVQEGDEFQLSITRLLPRSEQRKIGRFAQPGRVFRS